MFGFGGNPYTPEAGIARAQTALATAWNHFDWAVGDKAVDAAIYEVNVAEFQLQEALRQNGREVRKSA